MTPNPPEGKPIRHAQQALIDVASTIRRYLDETNAANAARFKHVRDAGGPRDGVQQRIAEVIDASHKRVKVDTTAAYADMIAAVTAVANELGDYLGLEPTTPAGITVVSHEREIGVQPGVVSSLVALLPTLGSRYVPLGDRQRLAADFGITGIVENERSGRTRLHLKITSSPGPSGFNAHTDPIAVIVQHADGVTFHPADPAPETSTPVGLKDKAVAWLKRTLFKQTGKRLRGELTAALGGTSTAAIAVLTNPRLAIPILVGTVVTSLPKIATAINRVREDNVDPHTRRVNLDQPLAGADTVTLARADLPIQPTGPDATNQLDHLIDTTRQEINQRDDLTDNQKQVLETALDKTYDDAADKLAQGQIMEGIVPLQFEAGRAYWIDERLGGRL